MWHFILTVTVIFNLTISFSQQKIEIINSDALYMRSNNNGNYKVLNGDVHLKKEELNIYCDSALIFEDKKLVQAIGHVYILKKDSIKLYCDTLIYDQNTEISTFKNNIKLIHKKLKLNSDILFYDNEKNIAFYNNYANIKHPDFTINSQKGKYFPDLDKALFIQNVNLYSDSFELKTDTLSYYQKSNYCQFKGKSEIIQDTTTAFCYMGNYNFNTQNTSLYKNAQVNNSDFILIADSIYLNDKYKKAEAFINVIWKDTANKTNIYSQYAYFKNDTTQFNNEILFLNYSNNDSLYLSSDTLYINNNDSVLHFYNNVSIKNKSLRSNCDSLVFLKKDQVFNLHDNPNIWIDSTLLKSDTIALELKNKKIDKIYLKNESWIINKIEFNLYNQIYGRNSKGKFKNDSLDILKSYGNGESIYFAQNEKGALVGLNKAICDTINIRFSNNKVSEVIFSGKPDAGFLPFNPKNVDLYYLKGFSYSIFNNSLIDKRISSYIFNTKPYSF